MLLMVRQKHLSLTTDLTARRLVIVLKEWAMGRALLILLLQLRALAVLRYIFWIKVNMASYMGQYLLSGHLVADIQVVQVISYTRSCLSLCS